MKKDGMTGPMASWCDTSQPAPVRMKSRVEYFGPTNSKLVKELVEKVFEEEKHRRSPRPNLRAIQKLEEKIVIQ